MTRFSPTLEKLPENTQAQESADMLLAGLSFLYCRYAISQSKNTARKIVTHIEKVLCHQDCIGFPDQRCDFHRLLAYWKAVCI